MRAARWHGPLARAGLAVAIWLFAGPAASQTSEADADLAKQLSNPVASLVSVPLQFNWDQPVGIDDDTRYLMNFQPVVPLSLNSDWNMIVRWIMPYLGQPILYEGGVPTSGFADITASVFFSPAKPGTFIWGVGPVLQLPTTSDPVLGSGKWSAGPTIVILKQLGGWTVGTLANQVWSYAGDDFTGGVERGDVNAMFLQPFLTYTTANATTFSLNMEGQANWASDDDTWTAPIHFVVTKLTKFGPFPMSIGGGVGVFAAAPGGRPDWRVRFQATLLLPRAQ